VFGDGVSAGWRSACERPVRNRLLPRQFGQRAHILPLLSVLMHDVSFSTEDSLISDARASSGAIASSVQHSAGMR
jgi:hypothetical protein